MVLPDEEETGFFESKKPFYDVTRVMLKDQDSTDKKKDKEDGKEKYGKKKPKPKKNPDDMEVDGEEEDLSAAANMRKHLRQANEHAQIEIAKHNDPAGEKRHNAFGSKIQAVCFLIEKIKREDAYGRVLVFCQAEKLRREVGNALDSMGFKYLDVKGSVKDQNE